MRERMALAFAVGLSLGCGSSSESSPAIDFSGLYTGTSTNGMNSCPGTWTMGATAEGSVNLVQSGDNVQFQTQGATSLVFLAVFGSASFSGKATGSHVEAVLVGSVTSTQGACSYTYTGTIAADLAGDTLSGTLTYTPNTNGNADCDTHKVTGCSRVTNFTYTRPAK